MTLVLPFFGVRRYEQVVGVGVVKDHTTTTYLRVLHLKNF